MEAPCRRPPDRRAFRSSGQGSKAPSSRQNIGGAMVQEHADGSSSVSTQITFVLAADSRLGGESPVADSVRAQLPGASRLNFEVTTA